MHRRRSRNQTTAPRAKPMAVMTFLKKGVMRNPFPCAATPSGCGSGALEAGLEPFERKVEDYRVGVFPPHKAAADRSVLHPDSPEAAIGVADSLGPLESAAAIGTILLDGQETLKAGRASDRLPKGRLRPYTPK
jgi:hypothetical protein